MALILVPHILLIFLLTILMHIYMNANFVKSQIFIKWSMTSEVIGGHIFVQNYFLFKICSYQNNSECQHNKDAIFS